MPTLARLLARILLETKRAKNSSRHCLFIKLRDLASGLLPTTTVAIPNKNCHKAMAQVWDYKRGTKNLPFQGQIQSEVGRYWTINMKRSLSNLLRSLGTHRSFLTTLSTSQATVPRWNNNSTMSTCHPRPKTRARRCTKFKKSQITTLRRRKAVKD